MKTNKTKKDISQIKLEKQFVVSTFSSQIELGLLKATLIAEVISTIKGKIENIEFSDTTDITFNDTKIDGYSNWLKFKKSMIEYGFDYDSMVLDEFKNIFTENKIKILLHKNILNAQLI